MYQRGEDRSQGNIEDSTATVMRAPNDMGYAAAALKQKGYKVRFRDFQTEQLDFDDLLNEFEAYWPDAIFVSVTNSTIFKDLEIARALKKRAHHLLVTLKGALFFMPEDDLLAQLDLGDVDYLIGGESDFVIADLLDAHYNDPNRVPSIQGILFRKAGRWVSTKFNGWDEDLEKLPFPDRSLIRNELYVRPDTGEAQATIATSRGCPAACIYCLTPTISGKMVRFRDPANILEELRECHHNYGIRNFFFKSDTFTINRHWVEQVCNAINLSELAGKIEWVANSRVRPLEKDTLKIMRKAGCWLVAFGFESGSDETMMKIRKGATVADNLDAGRFAKEAGLKLFGFFLIGLPWEGRSHLEATRRMMFEIDADFIELHIAVPYYGTPLYQLAKEAGLINETVLGKDYFNAPTIGTKHLSIDEIAAFRKKVILQYHLRPHYVVNKLRDVVRRPSVLKNYVRFGTKLIGATW
jgi:radical SAM superfamily enzyme YgiQ (UPF0313 family)